VPEDLPEPLGEDVDEALFHLVAPDAADRYNKLKAEYRSIFAEIKGRRKRALQDLKRWRAGPERYTDLEEEHRRLVAQHKADFTRKLWILLEELMDEE
jgi:hypothetical protein